MCGVVQNVTNTYVPTAFGDKKYYRVVRGGGHDVYIKHVLVVVMEFSSAQNGGNHNLCYLTIFTQLVICLSDDDDASLSDKNEKNINHFCSKHFVINKQKKLIDYITLILIV